MDECTSTMAPSDRINVHLGRRLELLQAWTPVDARSVLDVGCAFGAITAGLAVDGRERYGLDVNREYVIDAHSHYRDIAFLVGASEDLPFPDNHFDCVVMSEVLEHIADEPRSLAEVGFVDILGPWAPIRVHFLQSGPTRQENLSRCRQ